MCVFYYFISIPSLEHFIRSLHCDIIVSVSTKCNNCLYTMMSQFGDIMWHSKQGGEVMGMANFMGTHCIFIMIYRHVWNTLLN